MKLELINVKKQYGDKVVIQDMNVVFEPGIYGFLGPNGAGKSTTIRMICTVEPPEDGQILYDGEDIFHMGGSYREKLGYVPQKAGYYPDFTAYKFLQYIARLKDVENEGEVIKKCLEVVDLWDVKDKKIKEFSGGMKQRINVAQALLNDPPILILDEPTVGLDPDERMKLKNLLAGLAEKKIIIFATHIISDIEDIADKVIILQKGSIRLNAWMEDIMKQAGGKVWECVLQDVEVIRHVKEHFKVSRIQRRKDGVSMRIISDEQPCEGAVLVKESLGEVYLRLSQKNDIKQ